MNSPDTSPRAAATPGRAWLKQACRQPWRHELFALLRRIDAASPRLPRIGCASMPGDEAVRLGQTPSLMFAPREIARIAALPGGAWRVDVFGLGMLGPNGGLPLHYTELARERLHAARDSALADFLDLFHHRAFTLLYRAWAQAQAAAGLDRRDDEVFTRYIASIVGDAPGLPVADWPAHARWASGAQRLRRARDPQGLRAALQDFLRVPVSLREFVLQWLEIDPSQRSRLGRAGRGARLADAAVLGACVPDRQGRFSVCLGPLRLQDYLDFLPRRDRASRARAVQACVRGFVGMDLAWNLELILHADEARCAALGGPDTLGRSAWLGRAHAAADARGLLRQVFDAERVLAPPTQEFPA